MDYKEQIETLKNLEAIAYGYNINGEVLGMDCSDFEQIMVDAAESITDLLARAEAAEARCAEFKRSAERWERTSKNWEHNWSKELEIRKAAEARAEKAEKAIAELMGISPQQRITTCFGHPLDRVMDLVKADRAGRVKILSSTTGMTCGACEHFKRIPGTCRGKCSERPYCRDKYGYTDERRGEFMPAQSRIACKMFDRRKGAMDGV